MISAAPTAKASLCAGRYDPWGWTMDRVKGSVGTQHWNWTMSEICSEGPSGLGAE